MQARRVNNGFVLKLEKGDEIVSALQGFAEKRKIQAGFFHGIGGISEAELGYYNPGRKDYDVRKLGQGFYELLSIKGNISLKEGRRLVHAHVLLGKGNFSAIGGHLFSARVFPTCEILLAVFEEKIERKFDEESGLWLMGLE